MSMRVVKGHATENDFVLIDDRDGEMDLTAALARALCDRRAGIGADGVLRVVRSSLDPAAIAMSGDAPFFMDYRNADGSIAEMCGNGARLFVRYLQSQGLAGSRTAIATRGGIREAWVEDDDEITVAMGRAHVLEGDQLVRVGGSIADGSWPATAVLVPNPHVVVVLPTEVQLAGLELQRAPLVEPGLPDGQNVEFVVEVGERHLAMRVHERGVGETRSCGTGICAAVVATGGRAAQDGQPWRVDVAGGRCTVRWSPDGELFLTGPAEFVGEVELADGWLAGAPTAVGVARRG